MKREKAYKLLAIQERISNRMAKDLIDRGVVYCGGKKVKIARGLLSNSAKFKVEKISKFHKIFEDDKIIAVDKPPFMTSEEVSRALKTPLLHRLDKETSGVLLLVKDEEFQKRAIAEFRKENVLKEYIAWCQGKIVDEIVITDKILTTKGKNSVISEISPKGKEAYTKIEPLLIFGNMSKIKATIKTGRTHQIRIHLKSRDFPIYGDTKYLGREYKRTMLHSAKIKLFDYEFVAREPRDFEDLARKYL